MKFLNLLMTLLCLAIMPQAASAAEDNQPSKVFFTKDISPAGLKRIYEALERMPTGKVAVKLTVGEPGNSYHLAPNLIKDLVQSVNGTFIDGNTAYGGKRGTVAEHQKAAEDHGFLAVAPLDVLDADGEVRLPITGGTHLKEVRVGSHFKNYDSLMVLSHFKGHGMAGFGGALKNISIGISSPTGKRLVHTAGNSETDFLDGPEKQEYFIQSMAEASQGMIADMGAENILYISVMNNLSVDCDCVGTPAAPELHDIGILGSLDPVALDKVCVDLVYQADEVHSSSLRKRIEEKMGLEILPHAEKLGIGSQKYELVRLD